MTDDNNDNNNNFNDLEWVVSEEINKCDGCSGSCFLKELIEEQRKGLITEEEIVERLKEYYGEEWSVAGKYRTIEIYKQERVLAYESVEYAKPSEIDYQLNEIFEILRNTDLLNLDIEMQKDFVTSLISDLWKVHPFREGNTRTCLVFLRTYLNSYDIKFDVNFFKHENTYKYMRDALVASAFESDIYEKEREYKYLRRIIGDIIELDQERKRKLWKLM